ncbi:hypothetical protein H4S14_000106 [Agrobacterium vitis]|nr:hypothetical protein [Agrobacterium vitis]MBE1436379.1 hypothetical protein [Agrobacterium vitis]
MRPKIFLLEGVTRRPRHEVMMDIRDIVSAAGGWIAGETCFAAIAVTFRFSITPSHLEAFHTRILAASVCLDDSSLDRLTQAIAQSVPDQAEILVALNVTFSDGSTDPS